MKPTTEQQQFLSKYLSKNLSYRETYTEFYDHILSALETKPDIMDFQDAVDSIVTADFGGYDGMSGIETRYQKSIMGEMQKKYLAHVIDYLKFPLIGVTAVLAVVFYWIVVQPWFNFLVLIFLMAGMRLVARIIKGIIYFRTGYTFKNTKRSVKDGAFTWIDYIPGMLFILLVTPYYVFHSGGSPIDWFKTAYPITFVIALLALAIHTLSCYRVYKNEFKTIITR
jgi:hypothetical protein